MLTDRNLTSHTYREAMAEQVSSEVISTYKGLFLAIFGRMQVTG